ncbi:MAG: SDR family NAD(P)-dependent oxidoreductase [Traorella sp.]
MSNVKDINPDDYTLEDLGWDRVPTWMEGKCLYDMISLKGKTALVTGSGGIGLGKDIAHSLAGLGCEVVLVDKLESVHDVAKEVSEKWNVKTHSFVCDLTDYDAVGELFEKVYGVISGGKLDILVNNANFNAAGAIQDMTKEDIRISTEGPYLTQVNCCVHVSKHMIANGKGKIINIGSEASRKMSNPALALYGAAKSGVIGLTRLLASELAPYGIQVNGVAPGVMMHSRLRGYFENPSDDPRMVDVRKSIVMSAQESVQKRVSIPWEVANTVAFLCTDACSYINGQMIMNGGGITAP